jgi:7-methyl-GTP pyrophosphatase
MDLVLASTSPYRRALLERLGVPFRSLSPNVDEDTIKSANLDVRTLAERLARAKAESLCQAEPQATLIGSDQVLSFGGRAFGKPGTEARAIETLTALAGTTHQLITAIAVWHAGHVLSHTDIATLTMRPLTREEIARYVSADQPLDCAGAYKLEAMGITLFERIESADHTAVTGLPLIALTTMLRQLGYRIP